MQIELLEDEAIVFKELLKRIFKDNDLDIEEQMVCSEITKQIDNNLEMEAQDESRR